MNALLNKFFDKINSKGAMKAFLTDPQKNTVFFLFTMIFVTLPTIMPCR